MSAVFSELAIDAHDVRKQARFWCDVLGWDVLDEEGDDFAEIGRAGKMPTIAFVRVPEAKTIKNRVHIDVSPVDREQDAEVERILGLGATRVDVGQGDEVSWVVLADLEGNEFCVLKTRREVPD